MSETKWLKKDSLLVLAVVVIGGLESCLGLLSSVSISLHPVLLSLLLRRIYVFALPRKSLLPGSLPVVWVLGPRYLDFFYWHFC